MTSAAVPAQTACVTGASSGLGAIFAQRLGKRGFNLFVLIGAEAHTRWLAESIELDSHGFIVTGPDLSRQTRNAPAWEKLGRDPSGWCRHEQLSVSCAFGVGVWPGPLSLGRPAGGPVSGVRGGPVRIRS